VTTEFYNKTHLNLDLAEERQLVHRDYLAHCLRWTHVVRSAKMGLRVLDIGCGPEMPLAMMLYTNKFKPECYVGIDMRDSETPSKTNFPVYHVKGDATKYETFQKAMSHLVDSPDIITCFEVLEHMSHDAGRRLLDNISLVATTDTQIFISTPVFNGSAAGNHTAPDGTPMEWTYEDLKEDLEQRFIIQAHFGTFASQRDLKPVLTKCEQTVFEDLKRYYDSNLLAILLAPLHPAESRNVIWDLAAR